MKTLTFIFSTLFLLASFAAETKLMSFNVCHCAGLDGKIDIARTAELIRAEDPDFACLQELDWRTARACGADQPAELGRLTGLHATFAKAIFFQGGQYGVTILSREKPKEVFTFPLPGAEPRVLLLCEFSDCVVGTMHLSVSAEAERAASIERIRKAVGTFAGKKPVFLTGDWNSTPESAVLKEMEGFLEIVSHTDCQTYHGRQENGPDGQPLDMSKFCIDYIACDRASADAFKVLDAHVVEDRTTSDHAPVVVTLETPAVTPERPCVVPRPASLATDGGVYRAKACEAGGALFASRKTDGSIPHEGYRLKVCEEGISVAASDEAGFFYAEQTLKQLAFFSYGRLSFPCCTIEDAPRFGWRGTHMDDSRHFFGKAAVKRTLDLMAQHKLNVFHWHLTDNEGWRLPVAKYPLLTTVGAVRRCSENQKDLADRYEDGDYGPFAYTREDIREVVAYARERHIRVIPEVDVPGHCRALLKAYPEYGCFAACPEKAPHGAVDNVVCLGDAHALEMVYAIFDEVAELFPDELVHIGGDEVNKVNYRACPKCQARMRALGLKTENDLQAWFDCELGKRLARRGKRVLGWDELVLDGRPPENMVVMSWRGAEGARAAAKAGFQAVMCPHDFCYFDYSQCLDGDPGTYPWFTRRLPLEKAYAYDPLAGIAEEQGRFILGGQSCNWAEFTCNETELQWKMWPRTCATAEVFWSPAGARDYAAFLRRMATHRKRLLAQHVNCAPCPPAPEEPYAWRGFHLDEARHFFGKQTVKDYLVRMHELKLNVFHWHLTDDQGWRLDVPGFPELVRYGARRSSTPVPDSSNKSLAQDGKPYGPFYYTPEDVREIVAFAAERGIAVVPEFDLPGHLRALLAAHPEFSCAGDLKREPWTEWGVCKEVLCAGNEEALVYCERLLDAIMAMFPSEYMHIGGDECPKDAWRKCPKCQARMKALGLKDEEALQGWVTSRIVRHVASRGKRAIGWDEILKGGELPKGTVIQNWHGGKWATEAARRGHDVIQSPYEWTYFTFPEGLPGDPYHYRAWVAGKRLSAEKVRSFNPSADVPEDLRKHIVGAECCLWSEFVHDRKELDYKVQNRLSAFAEALSRPRD